MPASSHRVLEIGTGSGYAAAVLSRVVAEVYSIETVRPLFETAKKRLNELKYTNVHLRSGDGTNGGLAAPLTHTGISRAPLVPNPSEAWRKVGIPVGADKSRTCRITAPF